MEVRRNGRDHGVNEALAWCKKLYCREINTLIAGNYRSFGSERSIVHTKTPLDTLNQYINETVFFEFKYYQFNTFYK